MARNWAELMEEQKGYTRVMDVPTRKGAQCRETHIFGGTVYQCEEYGEHAICGHTYKGEEWLTFGEEKGPKNKPHKKKKVCGAVCYGTSFKCEDDAGHTGMCVHSYKGGWRHFEKRDDGTGPKTKTPKKTQKKAR